MTDENGKKFNQPANPASEVRINLNCFLAKEKGATLIFLFFLSICLLPFVLLTKGLFTILYLAAALPLFALVFAELFRRNRSVVLLGPTKIQFAESIKEFQPFPLWVRAPWSDVTRVQTFEMNQRKILLKKSPWFFGDYGIGFNTIRTKDTFVLATKIYVQTANGEEKALVVSISNERYSEFLNYLKDRIDRSKMDAKTIELLDPKILMDEMIKREAYY